MNVAEKAKLVQKRSRSIHELLHGLDPSVQGAILADLVSMWLAGHILLTERGTINRKATDNFRVKQAELWFDTVIKLIPESEKEIRAKLVEIEVPV